MPDNTWNITKLREKLGIVVKASARKPQTIIVDGSEKAVIVGIETWNKLNQINDKKKALKRYWDQVENLRSPHMDDIEANEDIPTTDWKKRVE